MWRELIIASLTEVYLFVALLFGICRKVSWKSALLEAELSQYLVFMVFNIGKVISGYILSRYMDSISVGVWLICDKYFFILSVSFDTITYSAKHHTCEQSFASS